MGGRPKRVVIYGRQSNDRGDESVSLEVQDAEVLAHLEKIGGREVVAVIHDPGEKRWTLERPGVRKLYAMASRGEMDEVWAWKGTRYGMHPHYDVLKGELASKGVAMRAVNDAGEGPQAAMVDTFSAVFAAQQLRDTVEHSRAAKELKARRGLVVGGPRATYGFRYAGDPGSRDYRSSYEADPEKMAVVALIMRLAVRRRSVRGIRRELHERGIPSPAGGEWWAPQTIRDIVCEDAYRPHEWVELENILPADVLARLDPAKRYGVFYYGRRDTHLSIENGKKRQNVKIKPREQWIPVPIPDSGIDPDLIRRARDALAGGVQGSSAGRRFWELSGILYCDTCGRKMQTHTTIARAGARRYFYYYCPGRRPNQPNPCAHKKNHRARETEDMVYERVRAYFADPERLRVGVREALRRRRESAAGGDPEREARAYEKRLAANRDKAARLLDLYLTDGIDRETFDARKATLETEAETLRTGVARARGQVAELERLERDAEAMLTIQEKRVLKVLDLMRPEDRAEYYGLMRLRVHLAPDGTITRLDTWVNLDGGEDVLERDNNTSVILLPPPPALATSPP